MSRINDHGSYPVCIVFRLSHDFFVNPFFVRIRSGFDLQLWIKIKIALSRAIGM